MKLTGVITRSLQADMQVELRGLERAMAAGRRDAGRGRTAMVLEDDAKARAEEILAGIRSARRVNGKANGHDSGD
jgi:hypothetical protein